MLKKAGMACLPACREAAKALFANRSKKSARKGNPCPRPGRVGFQTGESFQPSPHQALSGPRIGHVCRHSAFHRQCGNVLRECARRAAVGAKPGSGIAPIPQPSSGRQQPQSPALLRPQLPGRIMSCGLTHCSNCSAVTYPSARAVSLSVPPCLCACLAIWAALS